MYLTERCPYTKRNKVDTVNMTLIYCCHHRNDGKSIDLNMAQVKDYVKALNITLRRQWDCRTTTVPIRHILTT